MDIYYLFIQAIGFIGTVLYFASFQCKENKNLFRLQILSYSFSKMGLLFLPPAVGIVMYLDLLKAELLLIAITVFGGSIIILICTAHFTQFIIGRGGKK